MKKLIVFFIMLVTLFSLSSCVTSNGGKTYVSGDFKYKINSNSGEIMLIGFSDEGKTKETIVLPTMIGKRKVTTIGYLVDFTIDDGNGVWKADFRVSSYNKIYFHSFITKYNINSDYGIYWDADIDNLKVFYGRNFNENNLMLDNDLLISKCYIPMICKENNEDKTLYNYNNANVVYYLNDDTNDTFFADDCDGTKVNVIPPDPYRDGYEFMGWYKEKEGINKFDFDNDIIPNKQYDSNNNYIFKETSIYAKWESSAK